MPNMLKLNQADVLYRQWLANDPKAVFILVHGMGAHTDRWNFLADFLKDNNYSSFGIELKGYGETKEIKGHIDSFEIYYKDILNLSAEAIKQFPGKKVFILGESMGALIVYLLVSKKPELFAGQILISPAFGNGMPFPILDYIKLPIALILNPKTSFNMPFTSAMCTRDEIYQKVMDADNRESRIASAKLLINILFGQLQSAGLANKIKTPSLFLSAGKDMLVSPKASKAIFNKLTLKDKTLIEYPEMHHALSIDKDRENVFNDILNWANKRI